MLYTFVSPINRGLLRLFFRLTVSAPENIPGAGPLIVVANHESLLDGFVVAAALPRRQLTFLAASYLFDMRVVGWFLRSIGALPVKKSENNFGSLRRAIAVLKGGGTVAVFPEGGTLSSEILDGAAYLAVKARTPILPLHISGTAAALPPGRAWPSLSRIEVSVGQPFSIPEAGAGTAGVRRAVAEGRQLLERALRHPGT